MRWEILGSVSLAWRIISAMSTGCSCFIVAAIGDDGDPEDAHSHMLGNNIFWDSGHSYGVSADAVEHAVFGSGF